MTFLFGLFSRRLAAVLGICLIAVTWPAAGGHLWAQQPEYVPAAQLLPQSTAGLIRIPDFPKFSEAWDETHIGKLTADPLMEEFLEAQKKRAKSYLNSVDNSIGLQPDDLYEIASGEVVGAWLPFTNDQRRPFSVCLVADIRGLRAKADAVLEQIDKDMKTGGATREDVVYRGETIRVYTTKPKPGQLKIDQVAITLNDVRIIAADRDTVVQKLLDAVAGKASDPPLSELGIFKKVLEVSTDAITESAEEDGGTISIEWFAKPFEMGRILREVFEVDRGNQVDIIKLLEDQGFKAVLSAGGVIALDGKEFDLLHRGLIYAPFAANVQKKFAKAARILDFPNEPLSPIPGWVHPDSNTFNRLNWKMEDAFWASETLINDAFGDDIFRPMIDGIKEDEEGPQIDLEKDFFPNLDNQLILISDSTLPPAIDSDRMLMAVRITNPQAIKAAIRKAMEVEPDASKLDVIPGVEIWRMQRGESEDDFQAELIELGLEPVDEDEEAPPLLDHWAIAMVDQGAGSTDSYLLFSSHSDLLVMIAKRIRNGANPGMVDEQGVKRVVQAQKRLGAKMVMLDRVTRLKRSLRVKYELLPQGKLRESDSVMASLIRRLLEEEEVGEPDPLNAKTLPPLEKIEHHLPDGGTFIETTDDGWRLNGFFLK